MQAAGRQSALTGSTPALSVTRLRTGLRSSECASWRSACPTPGEQGRRRRPLLDFPPDWASDLADAEADRRADQFHPHARTGRPLGLEDFIKGVEARRAGCCARGSLVPRRGAKTLAPATGSPASGQNELRILSM